MVNLHTNNGNKYKNWLEEIYYIERRTVLHLGNKPLDVVQVFLDPDVLNVTAEKKAQTLETVQERIKRLLSLSNIEVSTVCDMDTILVYPSQHAIPKKVDSIFYALGRVMDQKKNEPGAGASAAIG